PRRKGRSSRSRVGSALNIPVKTFPVTVPLLGPAGVQFFKPPAARELSPEFWVNERLAIQYSLTSFEKAKDQLAKEHLPGPEWYRLLMMGNTLERIASSQPDLLAPKH